MNLFRYLDPFRTLAAYGLALLISLIGMAALPQAQVLERPWALAEAFLHWMWDPGTFNFKAGNGPDYRGGFLLYLPYVFGVFLGVGLAAANWARLRTVHPVFWMLAFTLVAFLPLTWHFLVRDQRLGFPGDPGGWIDEDLGWGSPIPSMLVALPFFALFLAALEGRMRAAQAVLSWRASAAWAGLLTVACLLASPFEPPLWLLFSPLIVAWTVPRLRRVGLLSFAFLIGALAIGVISSHYRFHRFMAALIPDPWSDPLGAGYQHTHALLLLSNSSWLGGKPSLEHLPGAMSQYLPVSIGAHWGWLAFGSVFLLMALWLFLTWPRHVDHHADATGEVYFKYITARVLWITLLFAVLDACVVNWLLMTPHGQGMPLLTGNWAFTATAWLLMWLMNDIAPGGVEEQTKEKPAPDGDDEQPVAVIEIDAHHARVLVGKGCSPAFQWLGAGEASHQAVDDTVKGHHPLDETELEGALDKLTGEIRQQSIAPEELGAIVLKAPDEAFRQQATQTLGSRYPTVVLHIGGVSHGEHILSVKRRPGFAALAARLLSVNLPASQVG